ncbi:MAG TPA: lipopolysaccharide biosynthesis protein [Nocardioides sp.]|nr:lipopolysaccharide biosynthesis protein [Nocardioides sp.]
MTERTASTAGHLDRVARGGALGLSGAVVSAIGGFGLAVVVTRGFDPDVAGVFFASVSVFAVLVAACSLGIETGLARFLLRLEAQDRVADSRRVLRVAAVPTLVTACLVAAFVAADADALGRSLHLGPDAALLLRLLMLALPFAVAADLCLSATRAFGRMRTTVVVDRLLRSGLQPLAALLVVAGGGGLLVLAASWAMAYVVSAVVAGIALSRFLRDRWAGAPSVVSAPGGRVGRDFWAFTWPRGVARLAQVGIQKADIVIVAVMLSPGHAALYTAATRFVAVGQLVTQSLQQVLQPRFTAILVHDDARTLREVYGVATSWAMLLAWPLYLAVGSSPAAYLSIFGEHYGPGASGVGVVVVVMAGAMLLAVASGPVDTLLLMAGRSGLSMLNAVTALVVDVVLCLLLIPVMGISGAAVAWAVAVTTRCGLAFVQVHHQLHISPVGRDQAVAALLPVACVGIPVGVFSAWTGAGLLGWLAVGLVSAAAYARSLWVFRERLHLDLLAASLVPRRPRRVNAPKESDTAWTSDDELVP